MKYSATLAALAATFASVSAHGIVSDIKLGSSVVQSYNPFQDPYMNPAPERITWAFPTAGNGPVEDVSSKDIVCNKGATSGKIYAEVAAGSSVTMFWTTWPESHRGPAMTYLANCNGDCTTVDPTTLSFFKIHHAGLSSNGVWASDEVIANNNSITFKLPSDIAAGNYLIRHELLALHSGGQVNGAQFYPMCANLKITGGGRAKPAGVKFPGAYKSDDAGILVDIYNNAAIKANQYVIPGPAVYTGGGSSDPVEEPTVPAPTTSASAPVVPSTTEPVVVPTATPTSAAPIFSDEPATSAPAPAPTASSSSSPPKPTTTEVTRPTFTIPSKPAVPTTAAPTAAPTQQPPSSGNPSVDYNKCLDLVNVCIAGAQSKNGGDVSAKIAECELGRSKCRRKLRRAIAMIQRV